MSPVGAVDFGDLDVTFSAPFYTGVFLSSRELQGTYELHQNIVKEGMKKRLQWGWNPPSNVPEFWNRRVSPPYFFGAEIDDSSSGLIKAISNLIRCSSMCKDYWFKYDPGKIHVSVKFFEFGYGSVSIRLREFSRNQIAVSSAKDLKEFLSNCEKVIRPILNFTASSATRSYRKSVPCCIKNSDIWDIDNFAGLEASEDMCRVGKVQEISTVAVLEREHQADFNGLSDELEKGFLYFSKDLNEVPYNAAYRLFTDEENITIALGKQKDDNELNDLFYIVEIVGVYLSAGKYFDNFFYSYFNYVSSEYEIIASKSLYRVPNMKRLRNLMEKFSDIETLYSQLCLQMQQINNHYINLYKDKLHNFSPQFLNAKKFWENLDRSFIRLKDKHETINKITSQSSFLASLDVAYIAILLAAVTPVIYIRLEPNTNILSTPQLIFAIYVFIIIFVVIIIYNSGRVVRRKLYYICGVQKEKYKDQLDNQAESNKDKFNCFCDVSACHRCRGDKWHRRVFYSKANLCFRCGKTHKTSNKAKNEFDEFNISNKSQKDEWNRRNFYREEKTSLTFGKNS